MSVKGLVVSVLFTAVAVSSAYGSSYQGRVTNEMIYQKLLEIENRVTEIEKRQAVFEERFKQIDKRFELIDKRFEDMNRRLEELREDMNRRFEDINDRFEDMNKRFGDINDRFDQLINFLWIITGIFTAIMVGAFGFAYWDRRTIIAEAKRQVYDEMEKEFKPEKFRKLLNALREVAEVNEEVKKILKKEGIL